MLIRNLKAVHFLLLEFYIFKNIFPLYFIFSRFILYFPPYFIFSRFILYFTALFFIFSLYYIFSWYFFTFSFCILYLKKNILPLSKRLLVFSFTRFSYTRIPENIFCSVKKCFFSYNRLFRGTSADKWRKLSPKLNIFSACLTSIRPNAIDLPTVLSGTDL